MSREALIDFVRAIERHQGLRHQAQACRDDAALIQLAHEHGFPLTVMDLATDKRDTDMNRWFEASRIRHPFRPLRS